MKHLLMIVLSSASLLMGAEPISLFDGTGLDQWDVRGKAEWRIEDGILVTGQDGDPKRAGQLYTKASFLNFELTLDFKMDEHGKYNSGVYFRRDFTRKGPSYQVNLGRAAAGEFTGLYLDDWLDKGDETDQHRKPLEWNHLRIRAVNARIEVWLNDVQIIDFTHDSPDKNLLKPGRIALQTYGAEGHDGWVHFRDIKIIETD